MRPSGSLERIECAGIRLDQDPARARLHARLKPIQDFFKEADRAQADCKDGAASAEDYDEQPRASR